MRALLLAFMLFVPSSLFGATITYTQSFSLTTDVTFSGFPDEDPFVDKHYFTPIGFVFDIPAFDDSVGVVEALFLDLGAIVTIKATLTPDTPAAVHLMLMDPFGFSPPGEVTGASYVMTYPAGSDPFSWIIAWHHDSHAAFDIRSEGTFHITWSGIAVATYLYTADDIAAVPEPSSLLLLGGGLVAARRRLSSPSRRVNARPYQAPATLRESAAVFRERGGVRAVKIPRFSPVTD